MVSLAATRNKAKRLQQQSHLLNAVASHVKMTLPRGVTRMELATFRLSCVFELSATLKMILGLQFKARKVLRGHVPPLLRPQAECHAEDDNAAAV